MVGRYSVSPVVIALVEGNRHKQEDVPATIFVHVFFSQMEL
jgi:hypothetical protein